MWIWTRAHALDDSLRCAQAEKPRNSSVRAAWPSQFRGSAESSAAKMAAQLDAAAETLAATAEIPSGHRLAADEAQANGEVTRFPTGLKDVQTPASDPWLFVQLADPQLGMLNSDQEDGTWDEEEATLSKAVDHINRLKPKFAIVCGDLVFTSFLRTSERRGMMGGKQSKQGRYKSL